jgi:hypothetical protein
MGRSPNLTLYFPSFWTKPSEENGEEMEASIAPKAQTEG